MQAVVGTLLQLNILHIIIQVLRAALIVVFVVQMVLSFVIRDQDNRFWRVINNITAPIVAPFEKIIPPLNLGGLSLSLGFIAGWWALTIVAALLLQALPNGW